MSEEIGKIEGCGMEMFGTLNKEKAVAILGDRWCPQTAKEEGRQDVQRVLCHMPKKRTERPNVGGLYEV